MAETYSYKVKNVSLKTDLSWNPLGYSIIVCPKSNEDYTTSFFYSVADMQKVFKVDNESQAKALVWQSCQILKTLKLA